MNGRDSQPTVFTSNQETYPPALVQSLRMYSAEVAAGNIRQLHLIAQRLKDAADLIEERICNAVETPAAPSMLASAVNGLDTLLRIAVSHIDMTALEISHQKHWALLVAFNRPAVKTNCSGSEGA